MIQVNIRNRFDDEIIYAAEIDSRFKDEPRSIRLRAAVLKALEEGRRDFSEADLHGADFSDIDFSIFGEVTFDRVDMTVADLTNADMRGVDLTNTDMRGAKLTRTRGVVDLTHYGPSFIGWWLNSVPMFTSIPISSKHIETHPIKDARRILRKNTRVWGALDRFGEIIAAQKGAG